MGKLAQLWKRFNLTTHLKMLHLRQAPVQNVNSHDFSVFAEVERIEARLAKYDENDKNKKPMLKALERLENTLSELGYEGETSRWGYIEVRTTKPALFRAKILLIKLPLSPVFINLLYFMKETNSARRN